jgi:hypothetical protein
VGKQEDMLANEVMSTQGESQEAARKRDKAAFRYEAEAKAIRLKMARRRALCPAERAAEPTAITTKPVKPGNKNFSSLSDWQKQQRRDGRHD